MHARTTAAARDARRRGWRRAAEEDGFTLAEMLVVLAILGTVLAGLTGLFTAAMKTQTDQTNRANAQQDARVALDQLRRELRCGSALTYNSASSVTVTLPPYCKTAPSVTAASPVTWCVTSTGPSHTLKRYVGDATVAGPACGNAGGVASTRWLVSSAVFTSYTRPATLVSAPTFVEAQSGGTIRPGTYAYDVTAVTPNGEFSGTPRQVTVTGGSASSTTNALTLSWSAYIDPSGAVATKYRIYGRDDGSTTAEGMRLLAEVTAPTTSYTDTGGAITALSSAVTLPTATIPVGDTSKFAWTPNTIAFASSGTVTCTTKTSTSFTGCSGGVAGIYPSGTPVFQARTAASPVDQSPPLATLNVSLAADQTPADTTQRFTLHDAISLRNSGRY
jgi:prepilin-type N-terminal cleavage/methylation domain-containing protein